MEISGYLVGLGTINDRLGDFWKYNPYTGLWVWMVAAIKEIKLECMAHNQFHR